jgi:sugar fermentation stimulation protein A
VKFDSPLRKGRLVRRYKRFLADVEIEGRVETAHCANPGSMRGLADPGARVWLSHSARPGRKLPLTWELVEADGTLVGINTSLANRLAEEAIRHGRIASLAGYGDIRREVAYGEGSRVDFLLGGDGGPPCYLEVKSVTMASGTLALFPDSVTARGTRHLAALAAMRRQGARAVMLFLAQRDDCDRFAVAAEIDPAYAAGLAAAQSAGVEILSYACRVSPQGIEATRPLALAPPRQASAADPLQIRVPGP